MFKKNVRSYTNVSDDTITPREVVTDTPREKINEYAIHNPEETKSFIKDPLYSLIEKYMQSLEYYWVDTLTQNLSELDTAYLRGSISAMRGMRTILEQMKENAQNREKPRINNKEDKEI